jgi:hypothetical protein
MNADLDIAMAQFAWDHFDPLLVGGIIDQQHLLGQELAESLVYLTDRAQGCGAASHPAAIDPALDLDKRPRFKLEVAFFNVLAVIVFEGAFDGDGVRVVPFSTAFFEGLKANLTTPDLIAAYVETYNEERRKFAAGLIAGRARIEKRLARTRPSTVDPLIFERHDSMLAWTQTVLGTRKRLSNHLIGS